MYIFVPLRALRNQLKFRVGVHVIRWGIACYSISNETRTLNVLRCYRAQCTMFVFAFAYSHRFQLPHFSCYLQRAMYCASTVLAHAPPLLRYPSYRRRRCCRSGICLVTESLLCSFDLQLHTLTHTFTHTHSAHTVPLSLQ